MEILKLKATTLDHLATQLEQVTNKGKIQFTILDFKESTMASKPTYELVIITTG